MQAVDVYVGTSLRGPARGAGKVMYIMRCRLQSGREGESRPEVMGLEGATEGRLVLYAIRDALQRLKYACEVRVHTECPYVAAAINGRWPERWAMEGWKNSKGKEVRDSVLWEDVYRLLEEDGHLMTAVAERHEFAGWMSWKLAFTPALEGAFSRVKDGDAERILLPG